MSDIKNDHEHDNDNHSTGYYDDLNYITEEYYVEIVTSTCHLSLTDVGTSNGGFDLSNSLDKFGINTPLKYLKPDPTSSCLENVNDISKGYLTDVVTSGLGLSASDISYSIGRVDLNAGLVGVDIIAPLGNFKLDPNAACLENVSDIAKENLTTTATSTLEFASTDVSYSIDGINLNATLDGVDINTQLGNFKLDPTASCLEDVNNIAKEYLTDTAKSILGLSSPDVSNSIGGVDLNAGLDRIDINTPLENIKINSTASCLENVNNIAKGYLIDYVKPTLDLSSPDVSYSIGGVDINAGLHGIDINTPLGNIKIDPTASCLENVNNIAKGYLTDAVTSAIGPSSLNESYSIGGVDLNAELDGVGIDTPLGNIKIDPTASCTENITNAVTGLLADSVNQEIDQFCSGFNNTARIQTDGSVYSDGTTSFLACQVNAGATIERDGLKANAQADGSLSKHKLGDADISVGHGQAYAKASVGADGVKVVAGGEINAVTLEHKNVQAKIGLSAKTGVEVSTTNISGTVLGLGLNVGTDGVGISTPIGSINSKFW
ncbi:unnamed protein product [Rotaria sordida]|uniref:Uncharacterized protein n=1 Tax=Rotaria sordida TaxID=392033 RepID=A0A819D676_9BILA|nr:unnamed protein product [Rotaria sordida]CAF0888293.1 unnamed protein product [Rotaria sordida]CAF3832949.1 unnamed protein product [Rotaria sordida]CAF3853004.1 unnamed protein product [Rotaria sordida]